MNFPTSLASSTTLPGHLLEMGIPNFWCRMAMIKPSFTMQIGNNFSNSIQSQKSSISPLILALIKEEILNTVTKEIVCSSLTHLVWFTITNTPMILLCINGTRQIMIWQMSMIRIYILEITDMPENWYESFEYYYSF